MGQRAHGGGELKGSTIWPRKVLTLFMWGKDTERLGIGPEEPRGYVPRRGKDLEKASLPEKGQLLQTLEPDGMNAEEKQTIAALKAQTGVI